IARIAVADRAAAGDEAHVAPVNAGIADRGLRGRHAIFGEVAAPFAPGVHADADDRDFVAHALAPSTGFHCQVSLPSGRLASGSVPSTSSISMPAFKSSTPTPSTTWPSTTIFSRSSSTAAMA